MTINIMITRPDNFHFKASQELTRVWHFLLLNSSKCLACGAEHGQVKNENVQVCDLGILLQTVVICTDKGH